jgi:hypothetical protein
MPNENISAETKAIIDRIKLEGQYVRNGGKHSIKEINQNIKYTNMCLEKFKGVFAEIAFSTKYTSRLLYDSAVNDQKFREVEDSRIEQANEAARRRSDNEEINPPTEAPASNNNDELVKTFSDRLKEFAGKGKEAAGGILGLFKNIAVAGAGLFVGYNILKGYIDAKYNGAWSAFEVKAGNWLKSAVDADWGNIKNIALALVGFSVLSKTLGIANIALLGIKGAVGAVRLGLSAFGAGGGSPAAGAGGGRGAPTPGGGGIGRAAKMILQRGGFAAIGGAMFAYSEEISDFMRSNVAGMDAKEIAKAKKEGGDAASIATDVASGAMIGMMFGPKGALIGAALGGALGIGKKLYAIIDDSINDTGDITNELEEAMDRKKVASRLLMERTKRDLTKIEKDAIKAYEEDQSISSVAMQEKSRLRKERLVVEKSIAKNKAIIANPTAADMEKQQTGIFGRSTGVEIANKEIEKLTLELAKLNNQSKTIDDLKLIKLQDLGAPGSGVLSPQVLDEKAKKLESMIKPIPRMNEEFSLRVKKTTDGSKGGTVNVIDNSTVTGGSQISSNQRGGDTNTIAASYGLGGSSQSSVYGGSWYPGGV